MKTKVLVAVLLGFFLLVIKLGNAQAETGAADQTPLKSSYVCMVNNKYLGKEQIPVPYEDKVYYGCCKGCVGNLQNNRAVRYSIDPGTGKEVDKATAYIVMQPGDSGEVFYFESEESYRKYKEK
jgi:YHS domain-containing protein